MSSPRVVGPVTEVLVAVEDVALRAAVERLAAVAGAASRRLACGDLPAHWPGSAAVVLDCVAAQATARAGLPRRPRVLLVAAEEITPAAWPLAVAVGAEAVHTLPREERQVTDWLAELSENDPAAAVVACLPARPGTGASTLAAALGLAAGARGDDTLLVDLDPWAGGVDFLLGIEALDGARWDQLAETSGLLPAATFARALPAVGRLRVLSCARSGPGQLPPAAVEAALVAGRRAHTVVVADLAGVCGAGAVTAYTRTALVVVPAEVRAVAAASAVVAELAGRCPDVRLVVRQPGPGGLRPRDVSDAVGAPLAAVWPWDRRLARVVERGRFARDWMRTGVGSVARELLETLLGATT